MWLIVIVALVAPFFIKGPSGEPLWSIDAVTAKFQLVKNTVLYKSKKLVARDKEKNLEPISVYKYQDEQGNWHYSDEPSGHPNEQSELVDPNRNVVPAYQPINPTGPDVAEPDNTQSSSESNETVIGDIDLPMILQPVKIDQLIEDTHSVRDELEKRPQKFESQMTL
ncbi:MAG: DUF4124 domain-containing protein [Gammaproteobacteria bacterium]|nr:DUF4124 domain-containing protein [Gammaproteobacteria bacterium]